MAVDSYLDFQISNKKIDGESMDDKFKKCMHILNYEFAVRQKGTSSTGSGLGAGKAEFDDFTFTKATDSASPQLMKHCASGTHFDKVALRLRKAGGSPKEFMTVTFKGVLISEFTQNGEEEATETVKFNYTSIFFEYKPQDQDGNLGAASKGGWDLKVNKEVLEGEAPKSA
ncbi:Hcp family type VI secretion system effector [Sphingomonas jatrophae]|uniref:Type VI secretion system secreted protein Hcp n=1 Tax=Sphingomonas jatrophae TaxID=1166337 RepID=A0A1I6LJY1_9SPHN|nr:type VI secretion system tube protein Hcp [Sphingomonas jatrophae]SFS03774.1 type VI secretion system secreted protein Hcp [Sphingomonas jatrophae]